jgi:hypothetical protein
MSPVASPVLVWWVALFASLIAAQWLMTVINRWRETVTLYGRFPLRESLQILRLTFWRQRFTHVAPGILLGVLLATPVDFPVIAYAPLIIGQIGMIISVCLPPAVLLLASSRWESVRLFNLLDRGVRPYRVVVFFEPAAVQRSRHSATTWLGFTEANLHLSNRQDWYFEVFQLTDSVPLIIVDTRAISPAVVAEVQRLIGNHLIQKTLFLVNDDNSSPIIDAADLDVRMPAENIVLFWGLLGRIRSRGQFRIAPDGADPARTRRLSFRYAAQVHKTMNRLVRLGVLLEQALALTELSYGRDRITELVRDLGGQLNGNPGDASPEIFAQLADDIAATEYVLDEIVAVRQSTYNLIYRRTRKVHRELCRLQHIVDALPPDIWKIHLEYLKSL